MANFIFTSFIPHMRIQTLPEIRNNKQQSFKGGKIPFKKLMPEMDFVARAYEEMQRENAFIFKSTLSPRAAESAEKLMTLPEYNIYLYPYLYEKKPSEIDYLYQLAQKTDLLGELRIPAPTLPWFTRLPEEELRLLEPIFLSKNDMGMWNYSPSFIYQLTENYDLRQIEIMSKLADCNVNGMNLRTIAENPYINHEKIIAKARGLKTLFGKNLREINFYSNEKRQNFLDADIQLPHREDKPDYQNFMRVKASLDDDVNPIANKGAADEINEYIRSIYQNIENRLHVFTFKDLIKAMKEVNQAIPEAPDIQVLRTMQRLTQFADYGCIKKLEHELNEHNIDVIVSDLGINPPFRYLSKKKKLIKLGDKMESTGKGILVTRDDLSGNNLGNLIKRAKDDPNVVFINLEGWSDGINLFGDNNQLATKTITILKKARKIQSKNPDYTFNDALSHALNNDVEKRLEHEGLNFVTIRLDNPASPADIIEQMHPLMPSETLLKSTIEAVAHYYSKGDNKVFKELCMKIAQYYDTNINTISKQGIIENLRKIHTKIDDFITTNNLSEEHLYFITPQTFKGEVKSFDLIKEMYFKLFNIPESKLLATYDICHANRYPANSTFVILDDVVGSGASMLEVGEYMFKAGVLRDDVHILFCPVTANKQGVEYITDFIKATHRDGIDKVLNLEESTKDYSKTREEFLKGKNFFINKEVFGKKGHGSGGMCTTFPYMMPDNDSTLAQYILRHFVPDPDCIKDKSKLLPEIEEEIYFYDIFGKNKEAVLKEAFYTTGNPYKKDSIWDAIRHLFRKETKS